MGQRLNIEIKLNETVLFNCYYHWSGYTESALELTKLALSAYNKKPNYSTDYYNIAVKMLLATGASFNSTEHRAYWAYVKEYNRQLMASPFFPENNEQHKLEQIRYNQHVDRNNGLISFTSLGIKETRDWEEARVTIDLSTETVNFDAVMYELDVNLAHNTVANLDFNLSKITFDDFDAFEAQLTANHQIAAFQKDILGQYISYIE